MKGRSDKAIFLALGVAGVLFLFYFMILGPKRNEASSLGQDITQLESSLEQAKQTTTFAEEARQEFPTYYGRLVVLGKAVPEQGDTASMLVQVNSLAERAGVDFRSIKLSDSAGGGGESGGSTAGSTTPAPAPTAPPAPGSDPSGTPPPTESAPPATGDTGATPASSTTSSTTSTAAPATEAAAASLPIGAVVGPAGLPTLPYELTFEGSFFDVANFMAEVDSLVTLREESGQVAADGRLLTVDGFALSAPTGGAVPDLEVDFSVTSYVTPAEQGLTAGASPGAPAPAPAAPSATPASATAEAP